jgi:hypothetical protein
MMNEARLVLPIPPGTSWRDAKPIVLPGMQRSEVRDQKSEKPKKLPSPKSSLTSDLRPLTSPSSPPPGKVAIVVGGKIRYIDRPGYVAPLAPEPVPAPKPKRAPRPKAKNDPKHVAAARELRDRWMEEINSGRYLPEARAKYEVSRALHLAATLDFGEHSRAASPLSLVGEARATQASPLRVLPAA